MPVGTASCASGTFRRTKSESVTEGWGTPRQVWRLAPPKSPSTSSTWCPARARAMPTLAATRLFPMPPFPPPKATMRRARWPGAGTAGASGRATSASPLGRAARPRRSTTLFSPKRFTVAACQSRGARPPDARKSSVPELDIPVAGVAEGEEGLPFAVAHPSDRTAEEGCPAGPHWLARQHHSGLCRRPATLPEVARDAAADHVFPRGAAALGAGDNVVEVELAARKCPSA